MSELSENHERFIQMWNDGHSVKDIAKVIGWTVGTTQVTAKILRKKGVTNLLDGVDRRAATKARRDGVQVPAVKIKSKPVEKEPDEVDPDDEENEDEPEALDIMQEARDWVANQVKSIAGVESEEIESELKGLLKVMEFARVVAKELE